MTSNNNHDDIVQPSENLLSVQPSSNPDVTMAPSPTDCSTSAAPCGKYDSFLLPNEYSNTNVESCREKKNYVLKKRVYVPQACLLLWEHKEGYFLMQPTKQIKKTKKKYFNLSIEMAMNRVKANDDTLITAMSAIIKPSSSSSSSSKPQMAPARRSSREKDTATKAKAKAKTEAEVEAEAEAEVVEAETQAQVQMQIQIQKQRQWLEMPTNLIHWKNKWQKHSKRSKQRHIERADRNEDKSDNANTN
ncbi:hypothetical protein RFI_02550, partial [Reticulomyxa filosa]